MPDPMTDERRAEIRENVAHIEEVARADAPDGPRYLSDELAPECLELLAEVERLRAENEALQEKYDRLRYESYDWCCCD